MINKPEGGKERTKKKIGYMIKNGAPSSSDYRKPYGAADRDADKDTRRGEKERREEQTLT